MHKLSSKVFVLKFLHAESNRQTAEVSLDFKKQILLIYLRDKTMDIQSVLCNLSAWLWAVLGPTLSAWRRCKTNI